MSSYIAMLRGINVSGQKLIKMADLKVHLEELELAHLQTYIQSGNIVFDIEGSSPRDLENLIHNKIIEAYGFEVPVIVRTKNDLEEVVQNNPFHEEAKPDPRRVLVTFLSETPSADRVKELQKLDYGPEQWHLRNADIYLYAPNGYGKAKMNNNLFEKKLKVQATTRNWKTVNILAQMAKGS